MKNRLQLQPGPSGEINFDYSYRRASAGELISHYIAVGAFSGIRNVILFAAMVHSRTLGFDEIVQHLRSDRQVRI